MSRTIHLVSSWKMTATTSGLIPQVLCTAAMSTTWNSSAQRHLSQFTIFNCSVQSQWSCVITQYSAHMLVSVTWQLTICAGGWSSGSLCLLLVTTSLNGFYSKLKGSSFFRPCLWTQSLNVQCSLQKLLKAISLVTSNSQGNPIVLFM